MATNAMKIGKIAWTDSFTPRTFSTVRRMIEKISTTTLLRCTGSHHVPTSAAARFSAPGPNHARGIMLKIASPPEALDVVIVRT